MRLRDYFQEFPAKAYDIRIAIISLAKAGYIEIEDGIGENIEDLRDASDLNAPGTLTLANATLAVSLKREGLLHYAALKQGSAEVRFTAWQTAVFWLVLVLTVLQTIATWQQSGFWPFSERAIR